MEQNISEEEAYELYKQDNHNVQIVKSVSKRAELQSQADNLIFSESEYLSLPNALKKRLMLWRFSFELFQMKNMRVLWQKNFLRDWASFINSCLGNRTSLDDKGDVFVE